MKHENGEVFDFKGVKLITEYSEENFCNGCYFYRNCKFATCMENENGSILFPCNNQIFKEYEPKGPLWETFTDKSYFDCSVVKRIDDKDFESPEIFHILNQKEAETLCKLLNTLQ